MQHLPLVLGGVILLLLFWLLARQRRADARVQLLFEKLLGSSTKGAVGEAILEDLLYPFLETGIVVRDLAITGTRGRVEFALELEPGLYCAIDQKTGRNPKKDIEDVSEKYINKPNTAFFGILTLPEGEYGSYSRHRDYAAARGVLVVRNIDLPYALPVLKMLHDRFRISKDTRLLNKRLAAFTILQSELTTAFADLDRQYAGFKERMERFINI